MSECGARSRQVLPGPTGQLTYQQRAPGGCDGPRLRAGIFAAVHIVYLAKFVGSSARTAGPCTCHGFTPEALGALGVVAFLAKVFLR